MKPPKAASRFELWWVYLVVLIPTLTEQLERGSFPDTPRQLITDVVVTTLLAVGAWKVRSDYQRMAKMSVTDVLSGLFNRRRYGQDVAREVARAHRVGTSLVLAYLDVDRFKSINDQHGHQVGDEAIKSIAALLKATTRVHVDTCYRVGGDEFAVLMPGLTAADATGAATRIEALGHTAPECLRPYGAGLSVGVALLEPGESAEQLERRAELQMYERKGGAAR